MENDLPLRLTHYRVCDCVDGVLVTINLREVTRHFLEAGPNDFVQALIQSCQTEGAAKEIQQVLGAARTKLQAQRSTVPNDSSSTSPTTESVDPESMIRCKGGTLIPCNITVLENRTQFFAARKSFNQSKSSTVRADVVDMGDYTADAVRFMTAYFTHCPEEHDWTPCLRQSELLDSVLELAVQHCLEDLWIDALWWYAVKKFSLSTAQPKQTNVMLDGKSITDFINDTNVSVSATSYDKPITFARYSALECYVHDCKRETADTYPWTLYSECCRSCIMIADRSDCYISNLAPKPFVELCIAVVVEASRVQSQHLTPMQPDKLISTKTGKLRTIIWAPLKASTFNFIRPYERFTQPVPHNTLFATITWVCNLMWTTTGLQIGHYSTFFSPEESDPDWNVICRKGIKEAFYWLKAGRWDLATVCKILGGIPTEHYTICKSHQEPTLARPCECAKMDETDWRKMEGPC